MRLLAGYSSAELGLGHLIQHSPGSAQRGAWRGSGFEAGTHGWASVRAAKGLLVSTTEAGPGSAQSTQMDVAQALAQLKSANALGQRLSEAAGAAGAQPMQAHHSSQAMDQLLHQIDPAQAGRHEADVNGQPARKAAADGRSLGEPVEAFAAPVVVLDSPSTVTLTTEAALQTFAGQHANLIAQSDLHQTAAHTWASVSGKTTSWYTHAGGIQAKAASGAVSVKAHADQLQILADKDVTVISVNDEIRISAAAKIEITAGQSRITLDGGDIEFRTPGAFTVKGAGHAFLGGGRGAASLAALPVGEAGIEPLELELNHHWPDLTPVAGAAYTVLLADGSQRSGKLDAHGHATLTGLPAGPVDVVYGEDTTAYVPKAASKVSITDDSLAADLRKLGFDPDDVDLQTLIEHEAGRQPG